MDNHEDLTFERLMSDLEKCVMQLDEGGISLDKAAQIYEEAMKFASLASSRLSDAEIKITTHAIEGLSENDFILAAKIDQLTNV